MEVFDPPPFSTLQIPTSSAQLILGLIQARQRASAEATDVIPRQPTRVPTAPDRAEQDNAQHGPADGDGPGQDNHGADDHQRATGQDADHRTQGGGD